MISILINPNDLQKFLKINQIGRPERNGQKDPHEDERRINQRSPG